MGTVNGAATCPECGSRMSIKSTNHGGGVTFRVAECDCGERWELEERRARRLQPYTAVHSRTQPEADASARVQPPTAVESRPPPPTAANPRVQPRGVRGGLPSGSDPESGPISPADPDRARARSNGHAPLTGPELCRIFGMLRSEVLGAGLPWQSAPADHGKAATVAEQINDDPHAHADLPATIRLFFRNVKAGRYDKAAEMAKNPAFAFGAWCSRFTAIREELHGKQPAPPMTPEERARADAKERAKREGDRAVEATNRYVASLRKFGSPERSIGIVTTDGRDVDVGAVVAELSDAKAATGG